MSFPRYPRYRDSGVEWLGAVPEHWEVRPLKRVATLKSGETISPTRISDVGEYPVFGGNGLRGYTSEYTHNGHFPLIGRQGALCGNINFAYGRFWASEHAVVAAPYEGVETRWLGELLRTMNLNQYSISAAQPGLSVEVLGHLRCAVPPVAEQVAIVSFLDYETAKIDALIAEQRRLIELLKEKRQSVVSHAVTKGLDPCAPMKDSGIEWLGEVPAHWEVLSIRRIAASVQTGRTPSRPPPSADLDRGLLWYTPGDFGGALRLGASARQIEPEAVASGDVSLFPPQSVFIVSIGATLGKVGFIDQAASANQQINVIIPAERVEGYFLSYSLSVKAPIMRYLSNASTIGIMNQEKTKDIPIALPPIAEQTLISAFLDKQVVELGGLLTEAERVIRILQERRTALISAAVTGKIDVRAAAELAEAA